MLAERQDLVEKIVLTKTFCEQGVYQVRFCKDGRWKIVIIDDHFPCNQYNMFMYSKVGIYSGRLSVRRACTKCDYVRTGRCNQYNMFMYSKVRPKKICLFPVT